MMSLIPYLVSVVALVGLGAFFWLWSSLPKDRVPPHLTELELKRLETEDKLRQTTYQVLGGAALFLTFLLTVIQATTSARQWSLDFQLRADQQHASQFSEILKLLASKDEPSVAAGMYGLFTIAYQDPEAYHAKVTDILMTYIRKFAIVDELKNAEAGFARECVADDLPSSREDRSNANPVVRAAMYILGDRKMAAYRTKNFSNWCNAPAVDAYRTTAFRSSTIQLDHLFLDNLDLNGADLSCAFMPASKFRRVDFRGALLRGADLSGAVLGDDLVPGMKEVMQIRDKEFRGGTYWLYEIEPDWRRYRCWIANFSGANLQAAKLNGARLSGADFTGADLSQGADLTWADVARANFTDSIVAEDALANACIGGDVKDLYKNQPRLPKKFRAGYVIRNSCEAGLQPPP